MPGLQVDRFYEARDEREIGDRLESEAVAHRGLLMCRRGFKKRRI